MATITKRLFHLRPTFHSYARPFPDSHHHFSSTSDREDAPPHSEGSSILSDIKASLHNKPPPDLRQPPRASTEDLRNRLKDFRSRSAPPPPSSGISMQEIYLKNVKSSGDSSDTPSSFGMSSLDSIREKLSKSEPTGAASSGMKLGGFSLSQFTGNLKNKADPNGKFASASGDLLSRFSMAGKGKGDGSARFSPVFGNKHSAAELGKKLQAMRPEKRKGKWFSLQELSNRLANLRQAEKDEFSKRAGFRDGISDAIFSLQNTNFKARHVTVPVLGSMGAVLEEKTAGPPKDDLLEKYFHPDNMSSAERLKLELAKVRDEFKMSESDCGSARVQVAQLTTKIKHLSTALHKKDKHSRRGLLGMVERRKKLLKYLRRTDWDSYSFVLSKLGLRDNFDIKA